MNIILYSIQEYKIDFKYYTLYIHGFNCIKVKEKGQKT